MSIFENAGEPLRRIRRQARQRRELAIQPSIMRAQSSLESEFNHDPISHPADRELYEGDVWHSHHSWLHRIPAQYATYSRSLY